MRRLFFAGLALPLLLSCSDKSKGVNNPDQGAKRDSSSLTYSDPVAAIDNIGERRERAAPLAALYKATHGKNWGNKTNWLNYDVPLSEWYGVETDRDGRITGLSLSENGLGGSIPPEVGQLVNLDTLDLGSNELSGSIPPELGQLGNLEYLSLSNNQLSGFVPAELGQLTNLKVLDLRGNQLSGCVPGALKKEAYKGDLPFCGDDQSEPPDGDPEASALAALYKANNHGKNWKKKTNWLNYDVPLSKWYGVETDSNGRIIGLSLSENGLWGSLPSELGQLTHLKGLNLEGNGLSGSIPPELGQLTNLEELRLFGNDLSGCVPAALNGIRYGGDLPFCGDEAKAGTEPDGAASPNQG